MPIVSYRKKVLFLPVVRGFYDLGLTQKVKADTRQTAAELGIDAIFPPDDAFTKGLICNNDDVRGYYTVWAPHLADIKALVVISSDFMRERSVQDTVRLLPPDVPIFMLLNNDRPVDQVAGGKIGDALCGSLSVHHNVRMLGRRIVRSAQIDMNDLGLLKQFLSQYQRILDGIESLRNQRVAMLGANLVEFTTTFSNQLKLFELGFSLVPMELITFWGDTLLAAQAPDKAMSFAGPWGETKFWKPISCDDPRVGPTIERIGGMIPKLPSDPRRAETLARCLLWLTDVFESEHIDSAVLHCWPEFSRWFGCAPCTIAMLANQWLRTPVACEMDIPHGIMARLAWEMTGEAGAILDINNNGWEPRVFNVFHCSQTTPGWLHGAIELTKGCTVQSPRMQSLPFTGVSAATSATDFHAIVFHGQFLAEDPGVRGSSGWAFVPNLPEVIHAIQQRGVHHFVAFKGHMGREVSDVLRFRGMNAMNLSQEVGNLSDLQKEVAIHKAPGMSRCRIFDQ